MGVFWIAIIFQLEFQCPLEVCVLFTYLPLGLTSPCYFTKANFPHLSFLSSPEGTFAPSAEYDV